MKITSIIVVIGMISMCYGQQTCSDLLLPYFISGTQVGIEWIKMTQDGQVSYAQGNSLYDTSFNINLANTDSYTGISNQAITCFNEKMQPFAIDKTIINFGDPASFTITRDGDVKINSVSLGTSQFKLTHCKNNIFSGFDDFGQLFSFVFNKGTKLPLLGQACTGPTIPPTNGPGNPPTDRVRFDTQLISQWNENGQNYYQFSTNIVNIGNTDITTLVFVQNALELRDPSSIYGVAVITIYQYSLPSYLKSIAPGNTHNFGYIAKSSVPPTFTVQNIYP
ncbi:hypothetical protein DLAC_06941 [Tieghemostelium lacteum]|uniref:Carbohydrate binding domain-containing protein n=1 Tax=Tieghemostelium lacteum TaxID=361077 RepID=A0A151ZDR3_TIELA|nr:hypothetical protein DLAC_06941 [Tieghemostelium lacteum]|eukprot:KYQ92102.1 hypothetical protein DLAC_06941 [Tieghemostelium lacteum]